MKLRLEYQGWSGCIVNADGATRGLPSIAFDPAPDATLGNDVAIVLITHGHPEHVRGIERHVSKRDRAVVHVLGSRSVCEYLKVRSCRPEDRFTEVSAGATVEVDGWRIQVFTWKHMGLLPPGTREKLGHLARLLSNPLHFIRIGLDGLFGPSHSPMLGFRVEPIAEDSKPLVYFGEGIHRHTSPEELRAGLGPKRFGTLLAAVEPEDVDALPKILGEHRAFDLLSFEAHYAWRKSFGMPQLDPSELKERMKGAGVSCLPLAPGDRVDIDGSIGARAFKPAEIS